MQIHPWEALERPDVLPNDESMYRPVILAAGETGQKDYILKVFSLSSGHNTAIAIIVSLIIHMRHKIGLKSTPF